MISSRYCTMAEVLISEVFKRPVLWDHRIKYYHNRDFVDKEWRNLSQTLNISRKYCYIACVFSLYTNLCTDRHIVHILLLIGRCHVGHKNAYPLHAHGSACTLVAGTQDVALYSDITILSL